MWLVSTSVILVYEYNRQLRHCRMDVLSITRNKVTQNHAVGKCNTLPSGDPRLRQWFEVGLPW
jgi:hypothetical protein